MLEDNSGDRVHFYRYVIYAVIALLQNCEENKSSNKHTICCCTV